jgi:hypothetical protein
VAQGNAAGAIGTGSMRQGQGMLSLGSSGVFFVATDGWAQMLADIANRPLLLRESVISGRHPARPAWRAWASTAEGWMICARCLLRSASSSPMRRTRPC